MAMANKPKFLEAWQQKDNVLEDNYLQQHFIEWREFSILNMKFRVWHPRHHDMHLPLAQGYYDINS
jgi:hypothetical protein